ncbi:MAG: biopolymer transporter ExbD [Candidatus Zixiibacteriota bacterium]|nr:MAG: biopolymer transporter ExbD [candidate division Zixibacteria bacterium]
MAGKIAKAVAGSGGSDLIRKKRRAAIRIDMTPMVDIAFLLLIFYMATTQFKPPEAKAVDLPQSRSQIELPAKDVITITVTRVDSIFVDYLEVVPPESDSNEPNMVIRHTAATDLPGLDKQIKRARAKRPFAYVVIKSDKNARYGTIQSITDVLRNENCGRFLLAAEQKAGKGGE